MPVLIATTFVATINFRGDIFNTTARGIVGKWWQIIKFTCDRTAKSLSLVAVMVDRCIHGAVQSGLGINYFTKDTAWLLNSDNETITCQGGVLTESSVALLYVPVFYRGRRWTLTHILIWFVHAFAQASRLRPKRSRNHMSGSQIAIDQLSPPQLQEVSRQLEQVNLLSKRKYIHECKSRNWRDCSRRASSC